MNNNYYNYIAATIADMSCKEICEWQVRYNNRIIIVRTKKIREDKKHFILLSSYDGEIYGMLPFDKEDYEIDNIYKWLVYLLRDTQFIKITE